MEDVISVSSGSEEDSDVEVVGVYKDCKDESRAFVTEWASFSGPYIDLTECYWAPTQRLNGITGNGSSLVVVDLSGYSLPDGFAVEPLSSALEFATSERKQKTPSHSPLHPFSCDKGDGAPNSFRNDVLVTHNISSHCPPSEQKEKQKPQDCISRNALSPPLKSPFSCAPYSLEKEKATESLCTATPEHADIPQRLEWKERTPEPQSHSIVTSNIPDDMQVTSSTTSHLEGDSGDAPHEEESNLSPPPTQSRLSAKEKSNDQDLLGNSFPDYPNVTSPLSPYSPYYCPSEIDPVLFSDDSSMHESQQDNTYTYSPALTASQDPLKDLSAEGLGSTVSPPHELLETATLSNRQLSSPHLPEACPHSPEHDQQLLQLSIASRPHMKSPSPTSTEILAGDSPDWLVDDAELPSDSPPSPLSLSSSVCPSSLPFPNSNEMDPFEFDLGAKSPKASSGPEDSDREDLSETEMGQCFREASKPDQQYVSRRQLNKLKHLMGTTLQNLHASDSGPELEDDAEEERVDPGPVEPICRQSLSLVYSTMEERYPESTLQLLSDFLHPRVYPPANVISHLIKEILLDPDSSQALIIEAYGLLMRIQKNHPATQSTVQWDWELLVSAMDKQRLDERLPSSVQCLLLQYVHQTLDDDFQLCLHRLHGSIAKATLSCSKQFMHVRDVINWLVTAVMNSTDDPREIACETKEEKQKERDENLKIVFILQKILALALEVDGYPACSSSKLSDDLFQTLISTVPHRCHRLLLLQTVQSRLLQCKVIELLLNHTCTDKIELPMSRSLLLHFVQSTMLPSDPTDGEEKWKKWNELVQLLWMLLLSYEDVTVGHLRRPVTQRAGYSHPPIWTVNDDITRFAVQEAAESFLSRASADIGDVLPPQVLESFSYLKDHLLFVCQH